MSRANVRRYGTSVTYSWVPASGRTMMEPKIRLRWTGSQGLSPELAPRATPRGSGAGGRARQGVLTTPCMRACVVVFPGSNADAELIHTLRDVCGAPTTVVWHTEHALPEGTDLVALPGGFSYGDYLRCGAIAKVSPIVQAIRAHADRGGYVLGICNGFQILTELGLLPGALTRNTHLRFECRDIHVKLTAEGPFTRRRGQVWRMPIAHAEGRYQATPEVLAELEDGGK